MSVKIIQISRKRAGLTHKEFCDYFYQNHGAISANGPSESSPPSAYSQIHFFDTVYNSHPPPPEVHVPPPIGANFNPRWGLHDGLAEITYDGLDHLHKNFGTEYVKTVTGPDAIKFIDFSAGITVLAREVDVISGPKDDIGTGTVSAVLAVAVRQPGVDVEATLTPQLTALLQASLGSGLVSLQANYAAAPEQAQSLAKYFGKQNGSPELAAVYVARLQGATLIHKFREAQKKFQDEAAGVLNVQNCFAALGRRVQAFNAEIKFDPSRQPRSY